MTTYKPLTTEQKLELSQQVLNLIEQKYPASEYVGQEDVLVLAYHASTDTRTLKNLLAPN